MEKTIKDILQNSQQELSEVGTIFHLILPLFNELGWKLGMVENLIFEDKTVTNKRVDIRFESSSSGFLLEAKRVGKSLDIKGFEQLIAYLNIDNKINFGILTNGVEYWIADNSKIGLENKIIYKFSIDKISQCDLEILNYFQFPLGRIDKLSKKIEVTQWQLELEERECSTIFKHQVTKQDKWSNFENLEQVQGKSFAEVFVEKVEYFLTQMEQDKKSLETVFKTFPQIFSFQKPNLKGVKSEKFNIWIKTHSSTKEKRRLLNKLKTYILN